MNATMQHASKLVEVYRNMFLLFLDMILRKADIDTGAVVSGQETSKVACEKQGTSAKGALEYCTRATAARGSGCGHMHMAMDLNDRT
jgi:hypothetical protein